MHTKNLKDFLVNFLGYSRLNLTNLLINLLVLSQLNLTLFLCEILENYTIFNCQHLQAWVLLIAFIP